MTDTYPGQDAEDRGLRPQDSPPAEQQPPAAGMQAEQQEATGPGLAVQSHNLSQPPSTPPVEQPAGQQDVPAPDQRPEPGTFAAGGSDHALYEVVMPGHVIRGQMRQVGERIMLTEEEGSQLMMAGAVSRRADAGREQALKDLRSNPVTRGSSN